MNLVARHTVVPPIQHDKNTGSANGSLMEDAIPEGAQIAP